MVSDTIRFSLIMKFLLQQGIWKASLVFKNVSIPHLSHTYYGDITWLVAQDNVQANFKATSTPVFLAPLWWETAVDQWIPFTNGQWRRKLFHVMTSSLFILLTNRCLNILANLEYLISTYCSELSQMMDIISQVKLLDWFTKYFQNSSKFKIIFFYDFSNIRTPTRSLFPH